MSQYIIQEETLTSIADAIRAKTGSTDAMTPGTMATAISEINTDGNTDIEDGIITRNITEYSNDRVDEIGDYAFYRCGWLTTVNLPLVTTIYEYAFYGCDRLKSFNAPELYTIYSYAFQDSNISSFYIPKARQIGTYAFSRNESIRTIVLPAATSLGGSSFSNCPKLTRVDFYSTLTIASFCFVSCYSLTALILRSETICTLKNTNAFNVCYHILGTTNSTYNPNGDKDGYIYVPSALVESYQAATNWSNYATQFRALESYTVDGTIMGELDSTKI